MANDRSRLFWRLCVLCGAGVIAFAVWFGGVIPTRTCSGPLPAGVSALLVYQLSRTPADIEGVFGRAGDPCRAAMIAAMDRANMVVPGVFLSRAVASRRRSRGTHRSRRCAHRTCLRRPRNVYAAAHHRRAPGQPSGADLARDREHREIPRPGGDLRVRRCGDGLPRQDRRPDRRRRLHRRRGDGCRRAFRGAHAGGSFGRQRTRVARHSLVRGDCQRAEAAWPASGVEPLSAASSAIRPNPCFLVPNGNRGQPSTRPLLRYSSRP
jgi:hypothetical protein